MIRYMIDDVDIEEEVVIFGAGEYGTYVLGGLIQRGVRVKYFCDNNGKYRIKAGIEVLSLKEIREKNQEYTYLIAVYCLEDKCAILSQLKSNSIEEDHIVIPLPLFDQPYFDLTIIRNERFVLPVVKMHWERRAVSGKQFAEYFFYNSIYSIVIIGNTEIAHFACSLLNESSVRVSSVVNKPENIKDTLTEAFLVVDIGNFDEIEEYLLKHYEIPVINLWEIIKK